MPELPSDDRRECSTRGQAKNLFSKDYDENLFSEEDNGNLLRRGVNQIAPMSTFVEAVAFMR